MTRKLKVAAITKVPVTERALVQRINRKLRSRDEVLKVARRRDRIGGPYFTVNVRINGLTGEHVDLEELGRELGALHPWEALA